MQTNMVNKNKTFLFKIKRQVRRVFPSKIERTVVSVFCTRCCEREYVESNALKE